MIKRGQNQKYSNTFVARGGGGEIEVVKLSEIENWISREGIISNKIFFQLTPSQNYFLKEKVSLIHSILIIFLFWGDFVNNYYFPIFILIRVLGNFLSFLVSLVFLAYTKVPIC